MNQHDTTIYLENREIQQFASEKKIESIDIQHYIKFGICRVRVMLTNQSVVHLKLSKRKVSEPRREKLFKSVEGVCKWARNLIEMSLRDNHATSFTFTIYNSDSVVIDEIYYSKNKPFDWDEHFNKND